MRSKKRQKGISVFAILVIASVLGLFFTIGVRLFPVYMDYYNVRSIMKQVAHSPGIGHKNFLGVWDAINERFDINDINGIHRKNLKMSTNNNLTTVTINYVVRRHLLANIDGLISFDYSVTYKHTGGG